MNIETLFTLAIALLTWWGVFAYLLHLGTRMRELEKKTRDEER